MIGIIPSSSKTFEVAGMFNCETLKEGQLYVDPADNRVYYYSTSLNRSCPLSGFFPIWDGKTKLVSKFSNEKYLDKDVIRTNVTDMLSKINTSVAKNIRYLHRRSSASEILKPTISDGDNMFTQVIKGIILKKELTIVDLIDMSGLQEKYVNNYYSALTKIAFMRMERWVIWVSQIFHLRYVLTVYKDDKKLMSYSFPDDEYDTGQVSYSNITRTDDDSFKKIVKILMIMKNITKADLRSDEVDDYTINNMLTTLGTKKPLSAQLFSRFIRMADLGYTVEMFENDQLLFEYKE
jgi:hypothetical protein